MLILLATTLWTFSTSFANSNSFVLKDVNITHWEQLWEINFTLCNNWATYYWDKWWEITFIIEWDNKKWWIILFNHYIYENFFQKWECKKYNIDSDKLSLIAWHHYLSRDISYYWTMRIVWVAWQGSIDYPNVWTVSYHTYKNNNISFAYDLTAKDKVLVDNLTTKVEKIIEKKWEKVRDSLINSIKKLAIKYKKQPRLETILLEVVNNLDNNIENEFDNILSNYDSSKAIKELSTKYTEYSRITFYIKNNQLFITKKYDEYNNTNNENYDGKYELWAPVKWIKDIESLKIVFHSYYWDLYSIAVDKYNIYGIGFWGDVKIIDNKLGINISKIEYINWTSHAPLSFFVIDGKFIYKVNGYLISKTNLDINTYKVNKDSITDSNGNKENIDKFPMY